MPPKRKNKAAKAASVSPLKPPPRNTNKVSEGTKPGQVRRNSLAATSGRTSRLPSIPFSMTTRRGAKTASAGSSSASSGSRRSSLNDDAQFQEAASDFELERPAKRSRTSTESQMSNGSLDNRPMNGVQRSDPQSNAPDATTTVPKTAGKKRRASDDSTESSKTINPRPNGVLTRTQSEVSEQQPRRKKRKTTRAPADSADQPPELTDASTAPNSPEQLPDVDGSQSLQNVLPTNGDAPAKPGRRLPGRRRQPHSDINIEVDLRRQLTLKMNYRSLAKVQKTLLEELSKRTLENLESNEDFHEQCPEYGPLMADLKQRRDGRIDQIDAVRTYRMEQLQRVRLAEERIQKEQYINRFRDLQDDFLLQCYYRMKQIEREMKGDEADATDDEENILPPTYTDEPHHDVEDRIGSKFASRSRAYVEADNELEDDARRRRFDQARAKFVADDEDANDSIEEVTGGFARFAGPDRDEAIAHYNLASMADAAIELERTPTPAPRLELPKLQVIPNVQAIDLMMLAELSGRHSHDATSQSATEQIQQPQQMKQEQELLRTATPPASQDFAKRISQHNAPSTSRLPSHMPHSSPVKASPAVVQHTQGVPKSEYGTTGFSRDVIPARVSTHRIMDMLNNDQDLPAYRGKEVQPTQQSPQQHPQQPHQPPSQPLPQEPSTPSRHQAVTSQHNTPSRDAPSIFDGGLESSEQPVDQALMDALGGRPSEPSPPPAAPQSQPFPRPSAAPAREPEEPPRRRDPLQKIRELLDRKARDSGRDVADRSNYGMRPLPYFYPSSSMQATQDAVAARDRQFAQDRQAAQGRQTGQERQATQERADIAAYDPTRPSAGLYSSSSSAAPPYPPAARRLSLDHGPSPWDRDRRMSGSQAQQPSQSPFGNPAKPSQVEHSRTVSGSASHQSPYSLPTGSLPLPPKPPGPPPPTTFRFAHYDPAPPRPSYPPPSPTYPAASQPPSLIPPPPQYAPNNYHSSYQGGYVPPPGSFQAPPPPPSLPGYPPLKIHQYGGQPILPANMAPPPHTGPQMPYHGLQQAPQPQPQPHAFSPPQAQPPRPQYESVREEQPRERPPEPQSRPRRQYRSYHAPGTQFRTYSGPSEHRRRGG
ncbi:hypothetical protein DE146DRAFT_259156 [Phaeosphaeria sp. MPI-PUGE-AT-0046c]|nr:hypothetical protein DE146DRAFT_259156 [Phaeosphaeria sp. MPI-PUGE-AT-0046c]